MSRYWNVPEVDFDVEKCEGDEGRDPEDDSEGKVHVELDVHRVIPRAGIRRIMINEWNNASAQARMALTLKAIITLIRCANKRWVREGGKEGGQTQSWQEAGNEEGRGRIATTFLRGRQMAEMNNGEAKNSQMTISEGGRSHCTKPHLEISPRMVLRA